MNKKKSRIRRASNSRYKLKKLKAIRLIVHRTSKHIYAQIIEPKNSKILITSSTLQKYVINNKINTSNKISASIIGKNLAEKALKKGIKKVSFDRSGFKYHGRIKALAESARASGLQF
ncbi:50S ribosomal protein L18 [Sodalis-like secondary symbiont of Drepanosiphum platanoidis]|uniref:50S ribosomal protein L18 n=1 Tax=Sodalis-like secondary symbiont of Drepanosiphum platanoidis TaxID=2994493 RepID=UPI003463E39B